MKRTRSNTFGIENESYSPSIPSEDRIEVTTAETKCLSCSPKWHSCHRQGRRMFPKNLFAGSCLVAALTLMVGIAPSPVLSVEDASMARISGITSTIAMTGLGGGDPVKRSRARRLEKLQEEQENGSEDEVPLKENTPLHCTIPAGKCTQCTFSEQKTYEECQDTGRRQRFECISPGDPQNAGSEGETSDANYVMKSCKHTDFDEGVAMIQLQVFCLLIGSLSIMSVRKQKRLYSSMFDRRKQQGANATKSGSNSKSSKRDSSLFTEDDVEIEFTPMTNQQRERVPLMENGLARMEII